MGLKINNNSSYIGIQSLYLLQRWGDLNNYYADKARTTGGWWIIWELTWPLLIVSMVLMYAYGLFLLVIITPIDLLYRLVKNAATSIQSN